MATSISLNPFEIRAGLLHAMIKSSEGKAGLNPFEIRAGLLQPWHKALKPNPMCLNPFEIRAGLLRHIRGTKVLITLVLIPSKSGLGCYRPR